MPTTTVGADTQPVRPIKVTGPPRSASHMYYMQVHGKHDRRVSRFWRALGIPEYAKQALRHGAAVPMNLTPHVWYQVVLMMDLEDLPISVTPVEGVDASDNH